MCQAVVAREFKERKSLARIERKKYKQQKHEKMGRGKKRIFSVKIEISAQPNVRRTLCRAREKICCTNHQRVARSTMIIMLMSTNSTETENVTIQFFSTHTRSPPSSMPSILFHEKKDYIIAKMKERKEFLQEKKVYDLVP